MRAEETLIPTPKKLVSTNVYNTHGLGIEGAFPLAAEAFVFYAEKNLGLSFTSGNDITLSKNDSLKSGEYTLSVTNTSISVESSDNEGANHALATLLQLCKAKDGKLYAENVEISDFCDNNYRGCMIDCARNVHPLENLKSYVDTCWLYKLSHLHLHFTDNEAYTLPSKLFPALTSKHNCYTEAEISDLVSYAYSRGIQLVPEIDTPGHSAILREAYPDLFGKSNVLSFQEKTVLAMQDLYRELCDMFPYSEYIHIGADESDIMEWNSCEECIAFGRELDIKKEAIPPYFWPDWHLAERFFCHYVNKMAEAIIEKGRKPLVWEGFSREVNEYMTRDVTVMVFESFYQTARSLIRNGFKVINCSWRPTYIVVPSYFWGKEECYTWTVGTFCAVHPDSPYYNGKFVMEDTSSIIGGQLNAWGDTLSSVENGLEEEFQRIAENAPCIAENTWNLKKEGSYEEFAIRHKYCTEILNKITGKQI